MQMTTYIHVVDQELQTSLDPHAPHFPLYSIIWSFLEPPNHSPFSPHPLGADSFGTCSFCAKELHGQFFHETREGGLLEGLEGLGCRAASGALVAETGG